MQPSITSLHSELNVSGLPHQVIQPRKENGLNAGRYDEEFYVFSSVHGHFFLTVLE
jgi:hypothetical protein